MSPIAVLLLCLVAIAAADVVISNTVVTGSSVTTTGTASQNLIITNSSINAVDGSDSGIEIDHFNHSTITDSSLTSAQEIVYDHIELVSHVNSNLTSGYLCNTDDDDEASISFANVIDWVSTGSIYTSGQSIYIATDDVNGSPRRPFASYLQSVTSTNDVFISIYCYQPDTQRMQLDSSDKPVVYLKQYRHRTPSVITNPIFSGDWYGIFISTAVVDGQGSHNFQADYAAIWLVDVALSDSTMDFRRLRLIRSDLTDVDATGHRQRNDGNYYLDMDVRVFGTGTTTFNDIVFHNLHRGIRVQRNGRLQHGAGVDEYNFGDLGAPSVSSQKKLAKVKVSGPSFLYGEVGGHFRMTSTTTRFTCGSTNSDFDYDRHPTQEDISVIRTPSPDNCVDVFPANSDSIQFQCSTNNLYFHPNGNCWTVLEGSALDDLGPKICRASSSMVLTSDRSVLDGVSFTGVHTYLLTQVFREFVSGDVFDVQSRVSKYDFVVRNGRVTSVDEVSGSGSTADGVITHVYRVTVESQCDGTVETLYAGTIGRARGYAQRPDIYDNEYCNRGGQYKSSGSIVYASCLANQFCI